MSVHVQGSSFVLVSRDEVGESATKCLKYEKECVQSPAQLLPQMPAVTLFLTAALQAWCLPPHHSPIS